MMEVTREAEAAPRRLLRHRVLALRRGPPRGMVRLPHGQAEALHLRGGGAHRGPRRRAAFGGLVLRPQGQARSHHAARGREAEAGGAAGPGPPAQAPRAHRRGAVGPQHHLQPLRRHGPRPRRGRRGEALRLGRRGAAPGGHELLRLAALRRPEARPGLPGEGPHARRRRDGAPQPPRPTERPRPLRRCPGEALLEGALGGVAPAEPLPRRRAVRAGAALAAAAPHRPPGSLPPHRAALAGPPGLRLPELAVERGGEGLPAGGGGHRAARLHQVPGRHAPLPARARCCGGSHPAK